jgi:hypothetical protein
MRNSRSLPVLALALTSLSLCASSAKKPVRTVAADGLPEGRSTPEGAACDLARAFMQHDSALFRRIVIPPHGGKSGTEYAAFLDSVEASMRDEAARNEPSPGRPRRIVRLFAARHLSRDGPASYGYAAFGYKDVMFVDVIVLLQDWSALQNRTLVIQDRDGKWWVHPLPSIQPLLSAGLNEESPSTLEFTEAYRIER